MDGEEVVIAHRGEHGVREVARHRTAAPGNPQLELSHYPERSASRFLDHTPQPLTSGEAAFLQLDPGAAAWLTRAAAAGTSRVNVKMDQAVEFAAVYGDQQVDGALAAAVGRFMHHAHLVVTEGDSYRFAQARDGKGVTPLT